MRKYRHQVLTLFCLPRACEKTKEAFTESLGTVSMVEIREDLADRDRSREYLKLLCREQRVRANKQLFARLTKEAYYPEELKDLFEEWYDVKMKTALFPQYKEVRSCRTETAEKPARGGAYGELQEMIGLGEAKAVIGRALNYYRLQKTYKDRGVRQDRPAMHMVFTGNPGTAKTTAARLFARIMRENGLLSRGHLVEVGRGDLVGKYVGWTAQIVKAKFKAAMGGVLFIDEAYSLADDRGGSFGDEAINTIVQEMENRREDLVVIFAGYPAEMERFLQKNPGLRSRIAFHVPFADYSAEELCRIAELMGKKKGFAFTREAMEKMNALFERARGRADFGNGRFVRNLLEQAGMNLAQRVMAMDPDTVTGKALFLIEEEDIRFPAGESASPKYPIGFAS